MAYSQPQRFRAPQGGPVFLPPEVAAGLVGLEPDEPAPDPAAALAPSIPVPPPGAVPPANEAATPILPPPPEPLMRPEEPGLTPQQVQAAFERVAGSPQAPANEVAPTAPRPPPQPAPTTPDAVRAGGYAPVLDKQNQALAQERAAGAAQIEVDRQQAAAEAKLLHESGVRENAREAERARIQQETLADMARRSAAIDSEIDRVANMKRPPAVRMPILGAIGLAMGALGQAIAGRNDGSNPALDIMVKQIEANAQRHLADQEQQFKAIGMRRDQLAGMRSRLTDTNALYDGLAAAETRRVRNELARVAASSKNEAAQANLMKLDAMLEGKEAEYLAGAKDKQFALDDKVAQRKEQERANRDASARGWAGINEQRADRAERRYQFDENLKLQREKEANDLKIASLKDKGGKIAEAAKTAQTLGIRDPATSEILVNAKGQQMRAEAEKLEKQAEQMRASKAPNAAAAAEQFATRAAELRAEAESVHAITGRNAERADNVQKSLADTQTALSLIDTIKTDARKAGTKILNANELEARLGTNIEILGLQLKEAWKLGTLDDGTVRYLNGLTGGDPTKLTKSGIMGALGIGETRGEQTITKLDAVAKALETARYNDLRGLGSTGFRFKRDDEANRPESPAARRVLDEQTPLERAALVRGQLEMPAVADFRRGAQALFYGGTDDPESIEQSTSSKYPGLSAEQGKDVDGLLAQARGEDKSGADARAKLVQMASDRSRPEFSNAMLNVLRDNSPTTYRTAVAALPQEERDLRTADARGREQTRAGVVQGFASMDPAALAKIAVDDADARQELFRRAFAENEPAAQAAWQRAARNFRRAGAQ